MSKFQIDDKVMINHNGRYKGHVGTIKEIEEATAENGLDEARYIVEVSSNGFIIDVSERNLKQINQSEFEYYSEKVIMENAEPKDHNMFNKGDRVVIIKGLFLESHGTIVECLNPKSVVSYEILLDGEKEPRIYFEGNLAFEGSEQNIISEPVVEKEITAKFRIGDVVEDVNNPDQSLSYPLYLIKESILTNDENGKSKYMYEAAPISSPDENIICEEDSLQYYYHDNNYEEYIESVGNGLPAWRGELYNFFTVSEENYEDDYQNDTIPVIYMRHILNGHSIYERVGDMIKEYKDYIMSEMQITLYESLQRIRDSLRRKIASKDLADTDILHPGRLANKANIRFTEEELLLVDIIRNIDKKDIYPLNMTSLQIMQAIKEAYGTAYKVERTKNQIDLDKRTGEQYAPKKGQRKYRGESKTYNMTIEFIFNLDLKVIETAYPIN